MKLYLLFILLSVQLSVTAQTQALKQLQLNIEKLAQFKMMLQGMQSQYAMLQNQYSNIKNQATGSLALHRDFIERLSSISPKVRNAGAVVRILSLQQTIIAEYRTVSNIIKGNRSLQPSELLQLQNALSNVLSAVSRNIDALTLVLSPGKLQMTDPDRLEFLNTLTTDMERQLAHIRNFTSQAQQVLQLRDRLQQESQTLRKQFAIR